MSISSGSFRARSGAYRVVLYMKADAVVPANSTMVLPEGVSEFKEPATGAGSADSDVLEPDSESRLPAESVQVGALDMVFHRNVHHVATVLNVQIMANLFSMMSVMLESLAM